MPRALRVIPGPVTVYTATANHVEGPPLALSHYGAWLERETIKLPDKSRVRRRGFRTMRENLAIVSSQNMALIDSMKPTDLSAERKGIK